MWQKIHPCLFYMILAKQFFTSAKVELFWPTKTGLSFFVTQRRKFKAIGKEYHISQHDEFINVTLDHLKCYILIQSRGGSTYGLNRHRPPLPFDR